MSGKAYNPSSQREVSVGVDSVEVLPFAINRTGVTFGAIGGTIFLKGKSAATVTNGLPIVNGTTPITLCACHSGDWVKGPIFAIADGAGRTLIIVEGFNPDGEEM